MAAYGNSGQNQTKYNYEPVNWAAWGWGIVIFVAFMSFLVYQGFKAGNLPVSHQPPVTPRYEKVKLYKFQEPVLQYKGVVNDYWRIRVEYEKQRIASGK